MSLSDNLRRLARERVPTILRATPDRAGVRPLHVQRWIALQPPFQPTDSTRTFSPNILFQPTANSGVAKIRSIISGSGIR